MRHFLVLPLSSSTSRWVVVAAGLLRIVGCWAVGLL
jgi:hypothetical protein